MPKRPNPFGDCSPLQTKTHIGKKEVNLGINHAQNMQSVYDRTKDLLYQGSRKSCSPCNSEPMCDWTEAERRTMPLPARSLQGQLCIDTDGSLCGARDTPQASGLSFTFHAPARPPVGPGEAMDTDTPLLMNNNSVIMPYPPPSGQMTLDTCGKLSSKASGGPTLTAQTGGFRICQSCNRPSNMRPRVCTFCEKVTCSNCLRQCDNCEGLFCQVCSTIDYSDCFERTVCLQCHN